MPVLIILFVVLPIIEMSLLLTVGQHIGAFNTIGLVVLTAVIGSAMLRQQGLATLFRAREKMNSGEMPATEMAEGILLAIGGAFLITPGFVTDTIGFLCLLPFTRRWLIGKLAANAISAAYFATTKTTFSDPSEDDPDARTQYHKETRFKQKTRFESTTQSPFKSGQGKKPSETLDGDYKRDD